MNHTEQTMEALLEAVQQEINALQSLLSSLQRLKMGNPAPVKLELARNTNKTAETATAKRPVKTGGGGSASPTAAPTLRSKLWTPPVSLQRTNPRHCPKGYGRPPRGWRAEQSRHRHKEIARRQKRNRRQQ